MTDDITSKCEDCGASIYREHIDSGIARYEEGKLLCAHCVAEYEQAHDGTVGGEEEFVAPIAYDDDADDTEEMGESRIHVSTGSMLAGSGKWDDSRFKRPLDPKSPGASRCRTFHSKLNEGALEFMSTSINEWLDGDKNIVIKFSTSTIGVFEGKHPEPNLIVALFY